VTFGPDGNLYVGDSGFRTGNSAVLRYQGPSGPTPGAFMDVFVPTGSGGLLTTQAALFGPDGNGDGHQDLYVTNSEFTGVGADKAKNGNLKRFDGVTGAFIDTFISTGSGGLNNPTGLTFTETDPMTLAYLETAKAASAAPFSATSANVGATRVQVNAGGKGILTDDDGNTFPFHFALAAAVQDKGDILNAGCARHPRGMKMGIRLVTMVVTSSHSDTGGCPCLQYPRSWPSFPASSFGCSPVSTA
jgi:hypothetical protein